MKKTIVLLAFATLLTPSVLAGGKGSKKTKNNVAIKYLNDKFATYDKLQ